MKWYLLAWKNTFNSKGRARRKEYWIFYFFNYIINLLFNLADNLLGLNYGVRESYVAEDGFWGVISTYNSSGSGVLGSIFSILIIIPTFSVWVRRFHDVNKSGWWVLSLIIPLILVGLGVLMAMMHWPSAELVLGIGILVLIVFAIITLIWNCTAGTTGPNKYGDDPKQESPLTGYGGVFDENPM